MNLYRDGGDYIGWHSDSETADRPSEDGKHGVYSLSLGATRTFDLRHITSIPKLKAYKDIPEAERVLVNYSIPLGDGDLLFMDYVAVKKLWKHRIRKEPPATQKKTGRRFNITFREL